MKNKMNKILLLVDGNSLINRAYYGGSRLTLPDGTPVGAVYTFLNMLLRYSQEVHPTHLCVAFDLPAPTFRHELYAAYKGTRKGMDPDLAIQLPLLKQVLDALHINRIEQAGLEADDLLGSMAMQLRDEFEHVYLLSGDRDYFQLIRENVTVLYPAKEGKVTYYNEALLLDEYGCTPEMFIDLKALMGDKSDNIPGIPGVGEKTARKLLEEYRSLDSIMENCEQLKGSLKNKVAEAKSYIAQSRILVTIKLDADIEIPASSLRLVLADRQSIINILQEFRFQSLQNKIYKLYPIEQQEEISSVLAEENIAAEKNVEKVLFGSAEITEDFLSSLLQEKSAFDLACIFTAGEVYLHLLGGEYYYRMPLSQWTSLRNKLPPTLCCIVLSTKTAFDFMPKTSSWFDLSVYAYALGYAQKEESLLFLGQAFMEQGCLDVADFIWDGFDNIGNQFLLMHALSKAIRTEIAERSLGELLHKIDIPLVHVLAGMEKVGVQVNRQLLQRQQAEWEEEITGIAAKIYSLAGQEFNILSQQQLSKILYEDLGLPHGKKLKNGYSTSVEELEKIRDKHPIIAEILAYRQATKLLSTFILGLEKYIGEDQRIHTNYRHCLTQTGRLSSVDPNLQNIPVRTAEGRRIREAFEAKDGHLLVDADYSQIELRLLAHLSGDATLVRAFQNDEDIHALTAAGLFHVDLADVTSEMRAIGKTINFSIIYGISDFGLSQDLHIPIFEAREYIQAYYQRYPDVQKYLLSLIQFAKERGYVETMYGRRRYIPELRAKAYPMRQFGERIAMNSPIQGSAADIIRLAMVKVQERICRENLPYQLVLQIHDELVLEVPEKEAERAAILLKEEMEAVATLTIPLAADVHIGKNWLEAKG